MRTGPVKARRSTAAIVLGILLSAVGPLAASSPQPLDSKGQTGSDEAAASSNKAPAPRPGELEAEKRHVALYDEAIRPVRDHPLKEDEAKLLRQAVAAIDAGNIIGAKSLASALAEPVQRKLIEWYALFRGFGSAEAYHTFLSANPGWPGRNVLNARLETLLFEDPSGQELVEKVLLGREPQTGAGLAALARLAKSKGDTSRAETLARKAWREHDFPRAAEALLLDVFKDALRAEDHKWRIDRQLGGYVRWRAHRIERIAAAKRVLPMLSAQEQVKVNARIAAYREAGNARALLRKLPAETATDWGLAFNRVQELRRSGNRAEARKILLAAPTDPAIIPDLDGWWHERLFAAFDALKENDAKGAYALIRAPGPIGVNAANEQAFLAGWLALRKLGDAKEALGYFEAIAKAADGPLSRSRAAYWIGRTWEALGDSGKAEASYKHAASFPDTFDSHLARAKLGQSALEIRIMPPAAPTDEDLSAFNGLDSVRATVVAAKAGLPSAIVRQFLQHFRRHFDSEGSLAMAAHLAEALGDTQMAVRIGKTGNARGHNLIYYSYPVHAFPAYTPLRTPPETALLLAIARQESEFSTLIQSGAGARGLMQVMPITARHVCRDYKLTCSIPRLSSDKSYNTKLASAYVGDRMAEFDGSYVLTIAGYNAGPGRVRQWIREFGDPREPGIDPIDWIHRIPFEETRSYVQKVLSNVQIYRARLGTGSSVVRIKEDLVRTASTSADAKTAGAKRAAAD